MAFKASNVLPQEAYQTTKRAAVQLSVNVTSFNARMASSGADYDFLRDVYQTLTRSNNQFSSLKDTPGLAQFAKDQEVDPAYDVAMEFTSMQAAISSALSWMDTNIPTGVTLKTPTEWGDGTLVSAVFTPAQTSGLRAELTALVATIS